MKVYLDCYPCFFDQILKTSRKITTDERKIREILAEFATFVPRISAEATPPEIGREVYRIISEKTGVMDPYKEIKKICTRQALVLYPKLKEIIISSEDRLLTAIRVAIAGNIIDFGANADFDLTKDLEALLSQELAIDHYVEFRKTLKGAQEVLYLADNAGETVFDRLLIEELGRPVADMVISKGQGNYEGLSEETRPVFFLLKAKCSVIAHDLGVQKGSIVLKKAKNYQISREEGETS